LVLVVPPGFMYRTLALVELRVLTLFFLLSHARVAVEVVTVEQVPNPPLVVLVVLVAVVVAVGTRLLAQVPPIKVTPVEILGTVTRETPAPVAVVVVPVPLV
jgi:hypothetical protein